MVHDVESLFGTLPKTMHTLLEAWVLNQWATIKPFVAHQPAILACFVFLFLLALVIVFSVVVSIVLQRTMQLHGQFARVRERSECTGKLAELADLLFAHTHALTWDQLQAELQRGDASVRQVLPELSMTELKLHLGSVEDGRICKEDLVDALRLMVPEKLERKIAELRLEMQEGLRQIQQELRRSMPDTISNEIGDDKPFLTPRKSSASHRPGLLLESPSVPSTQEMSPPSPRPQHLGYSSLCEASVPSSPAPQGSPQGHQAHQAIVNTLGQRFDDSLRRLEVILLAELASIKGPTSPEGNRGSQMQSLTLDREGTKTTANSQMQSFEQRFDEMVRQTEVMVSAELAARHTCLEQRLVDLLSTQSMRSSSRHTSTLKDGPERVRVLVLSDTAGRSEPKDMGEGAAVTFEGVLRDSGLETCEKNHFTDGLATPWQLPMPLSYEDTPMEEEAPLVPRYTAATTRDEAATDPGSWAAMRHSLGSHPEPMEAWQALALEEIAWQEKPAEPLYREITDMVHT